MKISDLLNASPSSNEANSGGSSGKPNNPENPKSWPGKYNDEEDNNKRRRPYRYPGELSEVDPNVRQRDYYETQWLNYSRYNPRVCERINYESYTYNLGKRVVIEDPFNLIKFGYIDKTTNLPYRHYGIAPHVMANEFEKKLNLSRKYSFRLKAEEWDSDTFNFMSEIGKFNSPSNPGWTMITHNVINDLRNMR
jgi:hypothetical protein